MDISGDHQTGKHPTPPHFAPAPVHSFELIKSVSRADIHHDLFKTRMTADGKQIEEATKGKELAGDAERIARQKATGYCEFRVSRASRFCSEIMRILPPRLTLMSCFRISARHTHTGGSCYGGTPPTDGPNPGCCNTCDEVREAYVRRGWSFVNPDAVEQVRSRVSSRCSFFPAEQSLRRAGTSVLIAS